MTQRLSILLSAVLLACPRPAAAGADELTGKQIMEKAGDLSGLGLETSVAKVKMLLMDSTGQKRERLFVIRSKVSGGLRKMILKVLSPADVAGTGLLLLEKSKGSDDQYLYLPETGKVRKIAGKQSHGTFLSSDFLYWDLRHHDAGEADHERLPDDTVSGMKCRVVKSVPHQDADAPYGHIITWVAASNDVPVKMELFNPKGKKIKKLFNSRIEKKEGRWVVMESKMTDLIGGHSTQLLVQALEFKDDISDDEFTKIALQRVE